MQENRISQNRNLESGKSRIIKNWAGIYDLVNFFVFLIFGGTRALRQDIISMVQLREGDKVLDIGCGTGGLLIHTVEKYKTIKGYGIDASQEMISLARKKAVLKNCNTLNFEVARAESLPFENEVFDCVFSIFLLHHLPMESKLKSLKQVYRVLKPGKLFLLVDIDKPTTLLGCIIGMTRSNIKEVRDNMQMPLVKLLEKIGFSSLQLMRKDYGIFSFIKCRK